MLKMMTKNNGYYTNKKTQSSNNLDNVFFLRQNTMR